jgi:hypothetical protein
MILSIVRPGLQSCVIEIRKDDWRRCESFSGKCDGHRTAIDLNRPTFRRGIQMNCDKCGKKYSITANMSKRSNDGLCIDCSRESRRKRREQQVEQERMGPLPSFLQGKDGQKEQVRRKPLEELERPLNYSASPVTSTAENENVASWKRRYPSLSTHLELGKFMIQVVTWIAAIGIIVITIKEWRLEAT